MTSSNSQTEGAFHTMLRNKLVQELKQTSGTEINLSTLSYSIPEFLVNFPSIAHIKSVEDFTYLAANKKCLEFWGFESYEQMAHKTAFDLKKCRNGVWNDEMDKYAKKVMAEDENILRTGEPVRLHNPKEMLNSNGFIVNQDALKIPLFSSDKHPKVKGILTLAFESTRAESIENLFENYQSAYKNNVALGNKKFLEYIGVPVQTIFPLTLRETECLCVFSKYRKKTEAAKAMRISPKTLESHVRKIKLKLNVSDIEKILACFSTTKYRKF